MTYDDLGHSAEAALGGPFSDEEEAQRCAEVLGALVAQRRDKVVRSAWNALGPEGMQSLFASIPRPVLEGFLRKHRTPAPRKPGLADANLILRSGRVPGRAAQMLHFLGQGIATEAHRALSDGDPEVVSALVSGFHPAVLRAALVGDLCCKSPLTVAAGTWALGQLDLFGPELSDDPQIAQLAEAFAHVADLRCLRDDDHVQGDLEAEVDPEFRSLMTAGTESLVNALLDNHCDLDDLDSALEGYFGVITDALSTFESATAVIESGEVLGAQSIETLRAVCDAAEQLAERCEPIGGVPPLSLLVSAVEVARQFVIDDANVPPLASVVGPAALEPQLVELRAAAVGNDLKLTGFLSALQALVRAARDPEADPLVLSELEAAARAAFGADRFAATLTAAVRGTLLLPPEDDEDDDEDEEDDGGAVAESGDAIVADTPPDGDEGTELPAEVGTTTLDDNALQDTAPGDADAIATPLPPTDAAPSVPAPLTRPRLNQPVVAEPVAPAYNGDGTASEESEFEAAIELEERRNAGVFAALDAGNFSLAAWILEASGEPSTLAHCAALAAAIHGPGELADALGESLPELVSAGISGSEAVQLSAWAAALRASVLAPETAIYELVSIIASHFDDQAIDSVSGAVVAFGRRGLSLTKATALSAAGDLSGLEAQARQAAEATAEELVPRQFSFAPAGRVWKEWLLASGPLAALADAAANRIERSAAVRSAATEMKDRRVSRRAISDTERKVRDKSITKSIEGSAHQALCRHWDDAVNAALAWCDAADALAIRQRSASNSDEEAIEKLRRETSEARSDATRALELRGPGTAGALLILEEFYALTDGNSPVGTDAPLRAVRAGGLLLGDQGVQVALTPDGPLDLEAVLAGLGRDLGSAFDTRLERRDVPAALGLAELAQASLDAGARSMIERCNVVLSEARAEISGAARDVSALLDRARRQLYVSEDAYAALSGRLEAARDLERTDVARQLSELEAITAELATAKATAIERFDAMARARCVEFPDALSAVLERVAEGDLATATEMLQLAERGEDVSGATEERFGIESVFPAVPEAVGEGISDALIEAVTKRATFGPLDFTQLGERTSADVVNALADWRRLSDDKTPADMLGALRRPLRLMGIEAGNLERTATRDIPTSPQRKWFDLIKVSRTGKALVPFFGSASENRLRCVLVTGAPGPETLCEWIEQDRARVPVLVLHPGTMPMERRVALARLMRRRNLAPAVVADDAVLAWLAALGQFRFEPFMRATLPFTAGNPYRPPSGDCPIEMFYGRSVQLGAVQAQSGTCLVYGGRQLGKSALLRTAEREFNKVRDHVAVYINLKPPVDESGRPDVVWTELLAKLAEAGVLPSSRQAQRDAMAAVTAGVAAWLDAHPEGRILVLLDEADRYFDLDAQTSFVTTSRLKDLMDSRGRRFKVVWTGLHQVQRFATVSNHPIAHLGAPAVIGFLDPQPANNLIERPCDALGLRFESDALVSRILAYCNYQPALLHLFAHALIERMCVKGADRFNAVPITVAEADVEEVAGSRELQKAIKEKLELTLELDPRYKVITYTLAFLAHEQGPDLALSATALRTETTRWWPAGFAGVDASEFRSLLEELAGLGVLSADPTGGGWRLRSANVLRLLGTAEQVEEALLEEEAREPVPLESSEVRERLPGGRRAPFTRAQLADLIGTGASQVSLIVGSAATDADVVAEALRQAAAQRPPRFELSTPKNAAGFRKALAQATGEVPRVIISDLRAVHAEAAEESLRLALNRGADAPRSSVAFVVDPAGMEWWVPYLSPSADTPVQVLALRRYDQLGTRAWSSSYEDVFQDEGSRQDLLELTGGWPALIDLADDIIGANPAAPNSVVLGQLRELLSEEVVRRALASVLTDALPAAQGLFALLGADPTQSASAEELAELVDEPGVDGGAVVEALRSLGALATTPTGDLRAEALLARVWSAALAVKTSESH